MPDWENAAGPEGGDKSGAILVDDFDNHVTAMHADTDAGFAKEYQELQKYCAKQVKATHEHSSHPDNKCKNRYLNIVACKLIQIKAQLFSQIFPCSQTIIVE